MAASDSRPVIVPDLSKIANNNKTSNEEEMMASAENASPETYDDDGEPSFTAPRPLKRKRENVSPQNSAARESERKAEIIRLGIERRKKIMRIKNWCGGFRDALGDFIKDKHLEKLSDTELDALLEECKFIVASKTTGLVTDQTALSVVDWIQDGLKEHTSLKVDGPKVSLKQLAASKDCMDLIKELTLEYADFVYQRPEYRMILFLVNGVYAIHALNKDAQHLAQSQKPDALEQTQEPPPKRQRTEQDDKKDKDGYEMVS